MLATRKDGVFAPLPRQPFGSAALRRVRQPQPVAQAIYSLFAVLEWVVMTPDSGQDVAIVAIGRNEGDRLKSCLRAGAAAGRKDSQGGCGDGAPRCGHESFQPVVEQIQANGPRPCAGSGVAGRRRGALFCARSGQDLVLGPGVAGPGAGPCAVHPWPFAGGDAFWCMHCSLPASSAMAASAAGRPATPRSTFSSLCFRGSPRCRDCWPTIGARVAAMP